MRLPRKGALLVVPVVSALVLAGCGGGSGGSSAEKGVVTVRGGDPQNPLVPTNTQETEGTMVVDGLWTGLVNYNADTAQPENAMATSIEPSQKNTVFDIKFKKGWKFHDGTEVKADNFINAWNFGAYAPNGQNNAEFFQDIKGYEDVHPADENAKPKTDKMSGLQKVNDYEFKVTLSRPSITFKQKLGYNAFMPMPNSFFAAKDKNDWAKKPVGNGPFKFVSYQPSSMTKIVKNEDYIGPDKAQVKGVDFKIYQTYEAAYQDLIAGRLDFMEAVPPMGLANDKYKKDLDNRVINKDLMTETSVAIPNYLKDTAFRNPDFRHAISMAIDRKGITKEIFNGSRKPLDGWIPPAVPGSAKNACGDLCQFNPAKAKELIKKVGWKGEIPIYSNADGGHKEWIEAVANSINKTLDGTGVTAKFRPMPTFQTLRQAEQSDQLGGWVRSAWNFDYPSPENQLAALYQTGGSTNITNYSNPEFDKKLEEGMEAPDEQTASRTFSEAERMLVKDMPEIPLWTETGTSGYSDRIKSVKLSTLKRLPVLTSIQLTEENQ